MVKLGILFNIDELGGSLYADTAYRIFFDTLDTRQIPDCSLSDGDTNATLSGRENHYCIAVESPDASKIEAVKSALGKSNAKGLLPPSSRFLEDDLVRSEPLMLSAQIDLAGRLVCKTSWIIDAWEKSRKKHQDPSQAITKSPPTSTVKESDYFCQNCGASVSITDNICPNCGEILEDDESTDRELPKRYPKLRVIATVWTFLGWLFLAGGVVGVIGGLLLLVGSYSFPFGLPVLAIWVVACIVGSTTMFGAAETFQIFTDIEENTRRTAINTAK